MIASFVLQKNIQFTPVLKDTYMCFTQYHSMYFPLQENVSRSLSCLKQVSQLCTQAISSTPMPPWKPKLLLMLEKEQFSSGFFP